MRGWGESFASGVSRRASLSTTLSLVRTDVVLGKARPLMTPGCYELQNSIPHDRRAVKRESNAKVLCMR